MKMQALRTKITLCLSETLMSEFPTNGRGDAEHEFVFDYIYFAFCNEILL